MMPAARLTDMHVCPMVTPGVPPVPHVGGPISGPCAMQTLIAGLPAARVTDMCVCVGPPDTIVIGSFTCLIEGKPAARLGDQCAHGGTITFGCPTVLIGNSGGAGSPQGFAMSVARGAAAAFVETKTKTGRSENSGATSSNGKTGPGDASGSNQNSSWIEVEIIDERGVPIAGQLVRVTTANGECRESFTDARGLVRISGIAPGSTKVTLPDLDEAVWKRA